MVVIQGWQRACLERRIKQSIENRIMKSSAYPSKVKSALVTRLGKNRQPLGELFLGHKALQELRILMRIARVGADSKLDKSYGF